MDDRTLSRILRRVLATSLGAPLVVAMSCGGAVQSSAGPDGGSGVDASPDTNTGDDSCTGQACGAECAEGCTLVAACNDGTLDCHCACDGSVLPVDGGPDGANACAGQTCGACMPGCIPSQSCVNGALECGCSCAVDAGDPDADVDADAGDPCHPSQTQCPYYIPSWCIDGGLPDAMPTSAECAQLCDFPQSSGWCNLGTDPGGQPAVECFANCGVGRRTPGLARAPRRRGSALGRYLAAAARLEAASIGAFRTLRSELEAHGAPAHLLRDAVRAARDEARHTRATSTLALQHGMAPRLPRLRRRAPRSLEAIARENAVEGCVRETYGALVALVQSAVAGDDAVRRAMSSIARDEVRHAALSWRVARWIEPRLSAAERARVTRARRRALRDLRAEIASEPPASLRTRAGLPSAAQASALLDATARALGLA